MPERNAILASHAQAMQDCAMLRVHLCWFYQARETSFMHVPPFLPSHRDTFVSVRPRTLIDGTNHAMVFALPEKSFCKGTNLLGSSVLKLPTR